MSHQKSLRSSFLSPKLIALTPAIMLLSTGTAPTTAIAQSAQSTCPAQQFMAGASANRGFNAPSVSVSCSGTQVTVTSNGIPGYAFQQTTPNGLIERQQTTIFPQQATITGTKRRVAAQVGVTVNGIELHSGQMGPVPRNQAFGDAHHNNVLDGCDGHVNPSTGYHNHGIANANGCTKTGYKLTTGEMIVGYALDGWPIVLGGNYKSGYVQVADPSRNAQAAYRYNGATSANTLDECNGRRTANGAYVYHVTSSWPYTVGCFVGETLMSGAPKR